jgi:hypothetical protein
MRTTKLLLAVAMLTPLSGHAAYDYEWTFATTKCLTNCNAVTLSNGVRNSFGIITTTPTNGGLLDNQRSSGQDSFWNTTSSSDGNGKGNNQTFTLDKANNNVTGTPTVDAYGFSTTGASSTFETATLALYSGNGLGVSSSTNNNGITTDGVLGSAPAHAFDNVNSTDAGLFKFSQSVNLQSLTIGWVDKGTTTNPKTPDADVSVLAFTGGSTGKSFSGTIAGKSFSSLISDGWEFIGNYNLNIASLLPTTNPSHASTTINTGNVSSSFWLVTAYTSSVAAAAGKTNSIIGGTLDTTNDYFKISGLGANKVSTGTTPSGSTPEPTSLFLLASGMLGWRMTRKNQGQSVASIPA